MTTTTARTSVWARSLNWLKRIDAAANYDSTQYTIDRIAALQRQLEKTTSRLDHSAVDSDVTMNCIGTRAAV